MWPEGCHAGQAETGRMGASGDWDSCNRKRWRPSDQAPSGVGSLPCVRHRYLFVVENSIS